MKICVTGSSGQIGSYVVDIAREQGHEVVGLDLRPSQWTTHVGDIRRADDVARALENCDAVVHCAAHISVQGSIEDPLNDLDHNIVGTLRLLDASRLAGVKTFLQTSSAAVYGIPAILPIPETHPTLPLSPYGVSKLGCEHYVRVYHQLYGIRGVVVRPFNVYSPRQDPTNPYSGVLSKFVHAVANAQRPVIFGDGSQTRDFVHALDCARAMLQLVTRTTVQANSLTVNIGTSKETSIVEAARLLLQIAGNQATPEFLLSRPGDIPRSVADTGQARAIGWAPKMDLLQGLRELLSSACKSANSSFTRKS